MLTTTQTTNASRVRLHIAVPRSGISQHTISGERKQVPARPARPTMSRQTILSRGSIAVQRIF